MQEIVIAKAKAKKIVISKTGIAHNISNVNGVPTTALIARKTIRVGRNLKIAITTAEMVRSSMQLHYLEIPLEFRWRNASPESHKFWRIHTGIKASYLLSGKLNYESDIQGNKTESIKNRLNNWQYGAYLSFGFNTWNPYIYYGFQPIFQKNKTAVENNSSALHIGLKFYIL